VLKRVLLCEQDASVREAIGQALCSDFQIVSTADQTEALAQCREREFDALLLDLSSRARNGSDVLQRFQAFRPGLPVIAMSARAEQQDAIVGDPAVWAVLPKPLDFKFLTATLNYITNTNKTKTQPGNASPAF